MLLENWQLELSICAANFSFLVMPVLVVASLGVFFCVTLQQKGHLFAHIGWLSAGFFGCLIPAANLLVLRLGHGLLSGGRDPSQVPFAAEFASSRFSRTRSVLPQPFLQMLEEKSDYVRSEKVYPMLANGVSIRHSGTFTSPHLFSLYL